MDYLRQLRNDEKRRTFSLVTTLDPELANTVTPEIMTIVPKDSYIARIYAVTKVPFAAGATVTVAVAYGDDAGEVWFTALPLDTENVVTISPISDTAAKYGSGNQVASEFNQAAVDSAYGEVQIVAEFTEEPVTAGAYSR